MSKRGSLTKCQKRRKRMIGRWSEIYGDNFKCFWCREPLAKQDITVDHKIPLSAGGTNDEINLVPACRSCNQLRNKAHKLLGIVVSSFGADD